MGILSCLFSSDFQNKIVYEFPSSLWPAKCPTHLGVFDLISIIVFIKFLIVKFSPSQVVRLPSAACIQKPSTNILWGYQLSHDM